MASSADGINGSPQPIDDSDAAAATVGINGDVSALAVDRAIVELRRGRAVAVTDGDRSMILGAVESIQAPVLARLRAAAPRGLMLLITPERAEALGIAASEPCPLALGVPAAVELDAVRALAGIGEADAKPTTVTACTLREWPGTARMAAAAFRLAKAGRLLPALLGTNEAIPADRSLVRIDAAKVECDAHLLPCSLKLASRSRVPLADAEDCEIALFRDEHGLGEHLAVLIGRPDADGAVPVRLHSACLTGDLLGSLRCDCGEQLRTAVGRVAALGGGVLLYLDQEGRGIGLANKLRAYAIQDTGLDTVDADRHLGFRADERNYAVAAALLHELGIARIRLLTNNPEKISGLQEHGIDVTDRLPLVASSNSHNERYLKAKRDRAGHLAEESNGR